MVEKFNRAQLKQISRELEKQEQALKKSACWYMSRRLIPIKNRWNSREKEIKEKYGSKKYVLASENLNNKLPNGSYKDIINLILRLCRCNKVSEIPDGQINAAINIGNLMVDGYFYKLTNFLEEKTSV